MLNTTHTPAYALPNAATMMKAVKAEWDKAPSGPKKDAAHIYYTAAEAALKAHNELGCIVALQLTQAALHQTGMK